MWLTAKDEELTPEQIRQRVLFPTKKTPVTEHTGLQDKQQQLNALLKEAKRAIPNALKSLTAVLKKIEKTRINPQNKTGSVSAEQQQEGVESFQEFKKTMESLSAATQIIETNIIQPDPSIRHIYINALDIIKQTLDSVQQYIERSTQPASVGQPRGIRDHYKAKEEIENFVLQHYKSVKEIPKPWPYWLKLEWKKQKPTEQFSLVSEVTGRIQNELNKMFDLPDPQIGAIAQYDPEVYQKLEQAEVRRRELAKEALSVPVGLPDNVKQMYEVFYPEGVHWLIEPTVPRVAEPHALKPGEEERVQYALPQHKPGFVPKTGF